MGGARAWGGRALRRSAAILLAAAGCLGVACGDDSCPAGLRRVEGRCVNPIAGPDAGDGGGGDCGDGGPLALYFDGDGDGWGVDGSEEYGCEASEGQATQGGDCDDADAFVHPEAAERCNGQDDDCRGGPDDGLGCVAGEVVACATACGSTGVLTCSDACVPSPCVVPEEVCNHLDDNCDGLVDEDLQGWIGAPVQLTDDTVRQHLPVVGWTGTDIAVGWAAAETEGELRMTMQLGTYDLDGAPAVAPREIAQTDTVAESAALGVMGELALFGYALEPTDGQAEPVVALAPLVAGGGVVPVPLAAAGDMESWTSFEVLPTRNDGMIVSLLTPFGPPNEVRVESWSLDPILQTHTLTFSNLSFADVTLTPDDELLVAWSAAGEVLVGRYDGALGELDPPRIVTATGGQAGGGHVVSVGDGAMLVYGTVDNVLHAVPLAADLAPGDVFDIGTGFPFPDTVVSSGAEVLVLPVDFDEDVNLLVRLAPSGEPSHAEAVAGYPDRALTRAAWAGDRWAVVWLEPLPGTGAEVFLQTYGCPDAN